MSHDDAKRLLRQAATFDQRVEAVRKAFELGMPLWDIEEFLDWIDRLPAGHVPRQEPEPEKGNPEPPAGTP